MLRFQRLACDKMIGSSHIQSLVTAYDGDANGFFGSMGGHRNFLEQYALILEQENLSILDELGDFAGQRFPSDFDISSSESIFLGSFIFMMKTSQVKVIFIFTHLQNTLMTVVQPKRPTSLQLN